MKKIITLIAYITFFIPNNIVANKLEYYANNLNRCEHTKEIIDDYEPKNFNYTNNLISPSYIIEKKEQLPVIIIFGKLLNKNCEPVPDATIYAWQVSPNGKYNYQPSNNELLTKNPELFSNNTKEFLSNGITHTDNNGNFIFITMNPKKTNHATSHGINLKIIYTKTEEEEEILNQELVSPKKLYKNTKPEVKRINGNKKIFNTQLNFSSNNIEFNDIKYLNNRIYPYLEKNTIIYNYKINI